MSNRYSSIGFIHTFTTALVILMLAPTAWPASFQVIHNFQTYAIGPSSGLVFDSAGNAYGVTAAGGYNNAGTVYEISPTTGFHIIYGFNGADGKAPVGNLAIDSVGSLYGTTYEGGEFTQCNNGSGCGTVFRLSPPRGNGQWTQTTLYNFGGANDGQFPLGGLLLDSQGNLFGTAQGGEFGCGLVFSLAPAENDQWSQNILYSFIGDGCNPQGSLTLDALGNLYGTTVTNGVWNGGNVYELSPGENGQWTFDPIYEFNPNIKDGVNPYAGVTFDSVGNLYGTTGGGGVFGKGTVFELKPNAGTWKELILHHFAGGTDGQAPGAAVIFDSEGNLFGSTSNGGDRAGHGTLFRLSPGQNGQWNESLFVFSGNAHGQNPGYPLALDGSGNIYGTATAGPTKDGLAFRIVLGGKD